MRLQGWQIDGFGVLKDVHRDDLGPGVTVLLGENEAGKSTLLGFVRAVLFGFPDGRRRERKYPPLRGGRHGGRLLIRDRHDGLWTVERYADTRREVGVTRPDGSPGDETDLQALLGGADAGLFKSVFAFSLEELQDFDTLSEAGVRDRIYSAGISGAGRSAREVIGRLEQRMSDLLKQRRGRARMNDLVGELEDVRASEREAAALAGRFGELLAGEREQLATAERLAAAVAGVRDRKSRVEALVDTRPDWDELQKAQLELAGLPQVADESVPEQVAGLLRELERQRERETRLPGLDGVVAQERSKLDGALERLGEGWDVDRVRHFAVSVALTDAVQHWEESLEAAERRQDEARRRRETAEADVARVEARLERARAELPAQEPLRVEEITERETRLNSLRRDVEKLRELTQQEEQAAGVRTAATRGLWAAAGLAAAAAVGGAIALIADAGQLGAGLFIAAGLLLAAAAVFFAGLGRRHGSKLDDEATVVGRLSAQVAAAAAALGVAATAATPSTGELDDVQVRLNDERSARAGWDERWRTVERAEQDLAEAKRLAADEARRETQAAEALATAATQWTAWLAEHGLRDLSPGGALQLFDEAADARDADARLRAATTEADEIRRAAAAWRDEASAVLPACGRTADGLSDEALRSAIETLHEDLQRRRRLLDRIGGLEAQIAARLGVGGITCVVPQAGGDAEEEVSASAAPAAAGAGQPSAAATASLSAEPEAGVDPVVRELAEGDPGSWQDEAAELTAELERLQEERDGALQAAAASRAELDRIARSADVPRLQEERESLRAQLLDLAHEYRVVGAARALIAATLTAYVRERQPAVLAVGSEAFSAVTGGRYERIELDEAKGFESVVVVDRDGRRRSPEELSTGTQQQLYLALRLALVDEFAERTEPLPLIMDDCLVNFDPSRAAAVAELLAERSADGQCLLFTCHPETAELLDGQSAGPVRVVEMGSAC